MTLALDGRGNPDLKGHRSYFSISTISLADGFAGSDTAVFTDDHAAGTVPDITANSRDLTWDRDAGAITIRDAGTYLILVNWGLEAVSGGTTFETVSFAMQVNGTQTWPHATNYMEVGTAQTYDPWGSSAIWVYTAAAGDVIKPVMKSDGTGIKLSYGSTFSVLKAEGNYGYAHYSVTSTNTNENKQVTYLPMQNGDGSNGETGGTIVTGPMKNVSYTQSNGYYTLDASASPPLGHALILYSWNGRVLAYHGGGFNTSKILSLLVGPNAALTAGDVIDGAFDYAGDAAAQANSADATLNMASGSTSGAPREHTVAVMITGSTAGDKVYPSLYQNSKTYLGSCAGSSFTYFDITNNEGSNANAYLSMKFEEIQYHNDQKQSGISNPGLNVFDVDNYAANIEKSYYVSPTGITIDEDAGTFTLAHSGIYFIHWAQAIAGGSTDGTKTRELEILLNGGSSADACFQTSWTFDDSHKPNSKDVTLIMGFHAGDVLKFTCADVYGWSAAAFLNIAKVDDFAAHTLQANTVAEVLIADDFTINTHAINTLSRQYDRVPDQVPFILGTRGPLSLRGRVTSTIDTTPNVSTGDKKN